MFAAQREEASGAPQMLVVGAEQGSAAARERCPQDLKRSRWRGCCWPEPSGSVVSSVRMTSTQHVDTAASAQRPGSMSARAT